MVNTSFNTYIENEIFESDGASVSDRNIKLELKKIQLEPFTYKIPFFDSQHRKIALYAEKELARTVNDQTWIFEVETVCRFEWRSRTEIIYFELLEKGSVSLLHYWLLHTILPCMG